MTKVQTDFFTIQKEQSVNREKLAVLNLIPHEKRSAEQTAEHTTLQELIPKVEVRFQESLALLRAEQEKGVTIIDAEARELELLVGRANVGAIFAAAVEHRQTEGETAEIQKHFGLASNQVPLEMLRLDRGVEKRVAAVVPASIGDAVQAEPVVPILSTGDGAFLGIERPTVAVGDATYPVLSTAPTVAGPFTGSDEAGQTDANFVANNLSPERLQASYSYRRTDAARFAGLDSSLRLALNSGLQEALDKQAISGDDGLLTGTNLPNNNVSATSTFALYLSGLLYGRVDGRYARTPADVRMIVGAGTFTHASAAYKGNNSDESGVERLQEKSGGLMVSAHVPAVSGNKQNALIRLGMERGAAVQPMWQGVSLVVDEFSRTTQGEIIITGILLANFAITRKAQWRKQQTQHA